MKTIDQYTIGQKFILAGIDVVWEDDGEDFIYLSSNHNTLDIYSPTEVLNQWLKDGTLKPIEQ